MRVAYIFIERPAAGWIIPRIQFVGLAPGMFGDCRQMNKNLVIPGSRLTCLPIKSDWNLIPRTNRLLGKVVSDEIDPALQILMDGILGGLCRNSYTARLPQ